MIYDLNIPWSPTTTASSLQRTISFLSDLGYYTLAISFTQSDENLSSKLSNPIPALNFLDIPPKVIILQRCTLIYSDPGKNYRLSNLSTLYDILAVRPTNEKAFLSACLTVTEHSIISLDLTIRYPFHFKPKPLMTAVNRGVKIEICYGQCISSDSTGRKNFISNIMSIIRCTKGRGLIVSSEADHMLACRGIQDLINLLGVWGLSRERAVEGLGNNPREVVVNEGIKRTSFRGVVDVLDGGLDISAPKDDSSLKSKGKRLLEFLSHESVPQLSGNVNKRAKLD